MKRRVLKKGVEEGLMLIGLLVAIVGVGFAETYTFLPAIICITVLAGILGIESKYGRH